MSEQPTILLTKEEARALRAQALDAQKAEMRSAVFRITGVAPSSGFVANYLKERIQAAPDHPGGCYGCTLFTLDVDHGVSFFVPTFKVNLKTMGPSNIPMVLDPVVVHKKDFFAEIDKAIRAKYLPYLPSCGLQLVEGANLKDTMTISLILELDKD